MNYSEKPNTSLILNPKALVKPYRAIHWELVADKEVQKYLDRVKQLAAHHHMTGAPFADLAGVLFDYEVEVLPEDVQAGGLCDIWNKRLYLPGEDQMKTGRAMHILCHELGHAIQSFTVASIYQLDGQPLSQKIREEQQAETLAYHLWDVLFPGQQYLKAQQKFTTYFSLEDMDWLGQWHEGWVENDLILKVETNG